MALSSSLVTLGIFVGIYGLLALGLNLKFGYNGLLDIGHVAFYLIGAYTAALLVAPASSSQQFIEYVLGLNLPWVVAIPAAMLVSGLVGMLVAGGASSRPGERVAGSERRPKRASTRFSSTRGTMSATVPSAARGSASINTSL